LKGREGKLLFGEAPAPVSVRMTGQVHSTFAA
jgi:hypothetical protein